MKTILAYLALCLSFSLFSQKKLTVAEVYNYSIGDEIRYSYCYESWGDNCQNLYTYFHKKVIDKYYGLTGDTLFYKFSVVESIPKFLFNPQRLIYESKQYNQTIEIKNLDSLILDLYHVDTTGGFTMIDSVYISQAYNGKVVNHSYFSNNFEGGHSFTFIEGCGGWYGEEWFVPNARIYNIGFCKNGNSYFGKPVGQDEINQTAELIKIFPNPLIGNSFFFTIPVNQFHTIQVFNIFGNEVIKKNLNTDMVQSLTLPENTASGYYLIQFLGNENVHCEKLFVE